MNKKNRTLISSLSGLIIYSGASAIIILGGTAGSLTAPSSAFAEEKKKKFVITVRMLDRMKKLPGGIGPLGKVPVPEDNLQTPEKIELGKMLFFDPRLSGDGRIACSTCHYPGFGYSDGRPRAMGFKEELGRHSPTVLNAAYYETQFWDGRAGSLEEQAKGPILASSEMNNDKKKVVAFLNSVVGYRNLFNEVFGHDPTYDDVGKAIASFERTLVTPNSRFDQYSMGDKDALTDSEKRGLILFVSKASCSQCHKGANFSDNQFHNLGVPKAGPLKKDLGRFNVTKVNEDRGKFKTPTIRNISLTAPYMHNGSLATLEDVVQFYNEGGGDDRNKDQKIIPLGLNPMEEANLVAFMKALTGEVPRIVIPQLPQ